ncbi:MAG: hypothetical protein ACYTG5_23365 [Planctomycetota bacterium]
MLVDNAEIPGRAALPERMQALVDRQALPVRSGPEFELDLRRLASDIERRILWGYRVYEFVSRLPRLLTLLAVLALANLLFVWGYKPGCGFPLMPTVLVLGVGACLVALGRVRPWWVAAVALASHAGTMAYWLVRGVFFAATVPHNVAFEIALLGVAWYYRARDHAM